MDKADFEKRIRVTLKQIEESLKEFENRKRYGELTPDVIRAIPNDGLEQAVVDYVYLKVGEENYHDPELLSKLPVGPRVVYTTWWVDAEVNNGGFNQFFWNWPHESFARWAAEGFNVIGAAGHAELMSRAIETYRDEAARLEEYQDEGTVEALSESYHDNPLNELDREFFDLEDDLSALRITFIRNHPELFADRSDQH